MSNLTSELDILPNFWELMMTKHNILNFNEKNTSLILFKLFLKAFDITWYNGLIYKLN